MIQKQTLKSIKEKIPPDAEIYEAILPTVVEDEQYLQVFMVTKHVSPETVDEKDFVLKGFSEDSKKVDWRHILNYNLCFSLSWVFSISGISDK